MQYRHLLAPDLVDLLAGSIADATNVADIVVVDMAGDISKSNLALNN
jgi:hypothetical protein